MNETISSWLVTLGLTPNNIEYLFPVLSHYRNIVANKGITPYNVKELQRILFYNGSSQVYVSHSCCLDLNTMQITPVGLYSAWVDRGGLFKLHEKITKTSEFYDLDSYRVEFIESTGQFFTVAFDLEGNVLLNTHQMFDNIEDQNDEYHRLGKHDYLALLLNTIRTNAEKFRLPRVPKGILKLPESIQCTAST